MGKVSKEKKECYQCDQCDASYSTHPGLSRHKKETHSGKNVIYKCQYCEKVNTRKDNHTRHENSCKKKEKRTELKCTVCFRSFTTLFSLKRHSRSCKMKPVANLIPSQIPSSLLSDFPTTRRSFTALEMLFLYGEIGLNEVKLHIAAPDIDFAVSSVVNPTIPSVSEVASSSNDIKVDPSEVMDYVIDVDPMVDPIFDPIVDPVVAPMVDPMVDSIVDSIVDPIVDPILDTMVDSIVDSNVDPVVDPIVDPIVILWRSNGDPMVILFAILL